MEKHPKYRSIRRVLPIVIILLICLASFFAFIVLSKPSGNPFYEGKHLSEWLLLFQSQSPPEKEQAMQAVREIGLDALPFLEELVQNADFDSFEVKTRKWIYRRKHPVHDIRLMVFNGYRILGPDAGPSVRPLSKMLKDSEATVRSTAAGALGWIGPGADEAVSDLIAVALDDDIGYVRRDAASALGQICAGSNDARVVEALTEALDDEDTSVREYAGRSLKSVRGDAEKLE